LKIIVSTRMLSANKARESKQPKQRAENKTKII